MKLSTLLAQRKARAIPRGSMIEDSFSGDQNEATNEDWYENNTIVNGTSQLGSLQEGWTYGQTTVVYVAVVLISIIIVFGCAGNLLVILVVKTTRKLQTVSNIFVVNLSICDLLFVCLVLPFSIYTYITDGWNIDAHLCKFVGFLGYTLTGTTIITITLIAYNRYKLVLDVQGYKATFTPRNVRIMLCLAWMVPSFLLIPPLTEIWGKFGYQPMLVNCNLMLDHPSQLFKLFLLGVRIGIPLAFILFFYGKIYITIRQSHRRIHKTASTLSALEINNQRKEIHLTKMMVAIFVVFVVSYLPCTITGMIDWNTVLSKQFHMFCAITVYVGSAANPLIYGLMNSQFRDAYWRIICCSLKKAKALKKRRIGQLTLLGLPTNQNLSSSKMRSSDSGLGMQSSSDAEAREPIVRRLEDSNQDDRCLESGPEISSYNDVHWTLE